MARHDEYDEDRVVVIERESGGSNAIGMLLLGLAVGAGAALLFAPASGEETRARLSDEARRARQRVRDMTDDLADDVVDRVERARSVVDERVTRARDAVTSRTRAVGEAVDAGRAAAVQARADLERAVAESKRAYADSRRAYRDARGGTIGGANGGASGIADTPDLESDSGGTPGEG